MVQQPKKILIIKPSAMGDIVHALPVLSAVHKNYPDAEISWLVRTEFAGLLEGHPYLSGIILFDRNARINSSGQSTSKAGEDR